MKPGISPTNSRKVKTALTILPLEPGIPGVPLGPCGPCENKNRKINPKNRRCNQHDGKRVRSNDAFTSVNRTDQQAVHHLTPPVQFRVRVVMIVMVVKIWVYRSSMRLETYRCTLQTNVSRTSWQPWVALTARETQPTGLIWHKPHGNSSDA